MAYQIIKIYGERDEYYTVDDAAALLSISRSTARRRCKTGLMPTRKSGKRLLVPVKFIRRTLEQGWQV